MKFVLLMAFMFCTAFCVCAQAVTGGSRSPVVVGANAKIQYINEQRIKLDIPKELTPYLAGLLMSNNIATKTNIDQALIVWTKKFAELKTAVNALAEVNARNRLLAELDRGNFSEVERVLKLHTNYAPLVKTFPNSIQTSGDQSPIIIGDYGNITYAVTQVIQYDLPEGVTASLLSELRSKDNFVKKQGQQIKALEENVESKAELAKRWINQYRLLENQLKNSPDSIGRKAYGYFTIGDLKGALKVLDIASGSEVAMAKNRLLKAKILLLQLNYDSLDSQIKIIKTYYATSVPLLNDYASQMDYAKFLVDYISDLGSAVPTLLQAVENATTLNEQVEVRNYLSLAFSLVNKDKSIEYLEQAFNLLETNEPLTDTALIEQKSLIQYNLAIAYSGTTADTLVVKRSVVLIDNAAATLQRVGYDKFVRQYKMAVYQVAMGNLFVRLNDTLSASVQFHLALSFFEKANQDNSIYALPLANTYMVIGQLLTARGLNEFAMLYYRKAQAIVEPKVNVNSSIYFVALAQIYTAIIRTFEATIQTDSIYKYLHQLDLISQPFIEKNKEQFYFYQTAIATDLGRFYFLTGKTMLAKDYLLKAYQSYSANFSQVQYDKPKFYNCIASLNQVYQQLHLYNEALAYNYGLMGQLIKQAGASPLIFDDFIPQVYSQLADVFFSMGANNDSAIYYSQKAVRLASTKALQYPLLYNLQYYDLSWKAIAILLAKGKVDEAVDEAMQYTRSWENIYRVSEIARNFLRGASAESVARIALLFQQNAASALVPAVRNRLAAFADTCFVTAETQFSWQQNKNPAEQYRYANFLVVRAGFENFMLIAGIAGSGKSHKINKCNYAKAAKALAQKLPDFAGVQQILQQVNFLMADCP